MTPLTPDAQYSGERAGSNFATVVFGTLSFTLPDGRGQRLDRLYLLGLEPLPLGVCKRNRVDQNWPCNDVIADRLDDPAHNYETCKTRNGATVITKAFQAATSDESRALAAALGADAWDFSTHALDAAKADLEALASAVFEGLDSVRVTSSRAAPGPQRHRFNCFVVRGNHATDQWVGRTRPTGPESAHAGQTGQLPLCREKTESD